MKQTNIQHGTCILIFLFCNKFIQDFNVDAKMLFGLQITKSHAYIVKHLTETGVSQLHTTYKHDAVLYTR